MIIIIINLVQRYLLIYGYAFMSNVHTSASFIPSFRMTLLNTARVLPPIVLQRLLFAFLVYVVFICGHVCVYVW